MEGQAQLVQAVVLPAWDGTGGLSRKGISQSRWEHPEGALIYFEETRLLSLSTNTFLYFTLRDDRAPSWSAAHHSPCVIWYLPAMVGGRGCLHFEQHGNKIYWRSSPWFFDSVIALLSRVATRKITGFMAVMWSLFPHLPLNTHSLFKNDWKKKKWRKINKTLSFLKWKT